MQEVINCFAYKEGKRFSEVDLSDTHELLKDPNQFVWVGLYEPSETIMRNVQAKFGLHDLAIEDSHKAHQRPKIEFYGNSIFIVVRTINLDEVSNIKFGETHFFVGDNFIITIRHGSSTSYLDVRSRCESIPHLLSKGPGFALYAIMDFLVDQYFPVVHLMEQKLESLEEKIFKEKSSRQTTELIYQMKRDLLEIKLAVSPLIDVCNRLMRFDIQSISEKIRPYFRDVYDHVLRINEMVDSTRELLSTALEANFSLISISQNDVSKKFAGWAAIVSIPTLVAGFYGMNFRNIPELDWAYGFYAVLFITAALCILLYYILRRADWL